MNQQATEFAKKLILSSMLVIGLGCGSSNPSTTTAQPGMGVPGPVIVGSGGEQLTVSMSQANNQLQLNHSEMETIYETQNVPSTCTRSVQRGTRQDCHTENEQQCTTQNERECKDETFPVCQTIPRRVCETTQQCTTDTEQVCHGTGAQRVCTTVPHKTCKPVEVCQTKNDQVCHNETRQQCTTVPRQHCTTVPRQECTTVPVIIQEQYPCTKPTQVAVGQRLKLHQLAQISIIVRNPGNQNVSADSMVVTMNNGIVSVTATSVSGIQYQVQQISQNQSYPSATEELITVSFEVDVL